MEFVESPEESAEAAGVAEWIVQQAAAGVDFRNMAVLFRINAQSPAIEQALADRSIPYLVRGGERFYERPEVRQALLTLRTNARAMTGTEQGSAVDQMKEVLLALGWTQQPPDGAGALRERWESLAALLSVAEDMAAETKAGTNAATSDTALQLMPIEDPSRCRTFRPSWTAVPTHNTSQRLRALRSAHCIRQRAWNGMPWHC